MAKGRPFMHNVDYEELREMIRLGFTLKECSEYYNIPYQTLQYYARKFKLGRFSASLKEGKYDDDIIYWVDVMKYSQNMTARVLNIAQSHVCKRYGTLTKYRKREQEKQEWMRLKKATVKDAKKN